MSDITEFTTGALDGSGVFDQMMRTVEMHLVEEYKASRIRSPEYASVYLGSIQAVMDRSLQYILQKEKADKEVELLDAQIALLAAQTQSEELNHITLEKQHETEEIRQDLLRQELETGLLQQDLLSGQILTEASQRDNVVQQLENLKAQEDLTRSQVLSDEAQRNNTVQQLENLIADEALTSARKLNEEAQTSLIDEQVKSETKRNELDGLLDKEKERLIAQTAQIEAQTANAAKEGLQIEAQTDQISQQTTNLVSEDLRIKAQTSQIEQQTTNLVSEDLRIKAETSQIEKQSLLVDEQVISEQKRNELDGLMDKEKAHLEAQTEQIQSQKELTDQQVINAVTEETVLRGQKCKLDAEFDLLQEQKLKVGAETGLLNQKKVTEEAQTVEGKAGTNSVIGRQMDLFKAQTDGFKRDAEQKAANILARTWELRRTTDYNDTIANDENKLSDEYVGQAISKLLEGIGGNN